MEYIKDFIKSAIVGLIFGSILLIVVSGISIMFTKDLSQSLINGQRVTSIIGSVGLLIFSGFMLKKGGIQELENKPSFENHFKKFNYAIILLVISFFILVVSMLIDYVIFAL